MRVNDWFNLRLGDHITYFKGFAFKSQDYIDDGHPIVKVTNFTDRSINLSDCNFISPAKVKKYSNFQIRTGDVIIATVGSWPKNPDSVVGKTICVPYEANEALLNQNTLCLRANGQLGQQFLFYLLKDAGFQKYLIGGARGSANQASITIQSVFDYTFLCPPLPEQCAIAQILGALDDKIELNRRMNHTLESMARAVFRHWFVEYPDENWKLETFGNVIKFVKGKKPPETADNKIDGYLPLILIDSFDTGNSTYADPEKMIIAHTNNPLMVMDGASSGRVEIGYHGIVGSTIAMITSNGKVGDYYLYYSLKEKELEARERLTGTSIPHMDKYWLLGQEICIPNEKKTLEFEIFAETIRKKVTANLKESRTLAELRDALLPKLMRGEVRVKDVEEIL